MNHSIFWTNLAPKNADGGVLPDASSDLAQEVARRFGSFEAFMGTFNAQTVAVQGMTLLLHSIRASLALSLSLSCQMSS